MEELSDSKPETKRIFMNYVDLYQGKNIAKYLSQCVVGASLEDVEEEEEEASSEFGGVQAVKEGCYQVIGTLKEKNGPKPDFVKEILKYDTKEQLYEHMMECDVIIYDITSDASQIDEAVWAVSQLHSDMDRLQKPHIFILLSTVITWAKTKSVDEDPEVPFTEEDYRGRRPHPNFKEHVSAEKTVMKLGKTNKSKLITYVVAAGLTYGFEEKIFHYLFKSAWHNVPGLLCYGKGRNVLPTIHVRDLAGVLQNIADERPKVRYIIAVDDSKNTQYEIVKAVSKAMGSGKVLRVDKEEGLLNNNIEQHEFDQLLVNLHMDAVYVKNDMRIKWKTEGGIVENMQSLVKEFKDIRKLQPLKAFITGPPACGKTTVIQQLCEHYKVHHIMIKDVIDSAIQTLQKNASRQVGGEEAATPVPRAPSGAGETEEEEEELEEEEEEGMSAEDAQQRLDEINASRQENNGRLEDQFVNQFVQEKLRSKPCQNQGYIIDGYPKTIDQAKDVFAVNEEDEEVAEDAKFDKQTMPEFVVCLEADDAFLKARVMNLAESVVANTHNTEKELSRRLDYYRSVNTDDDTVLNYFDELEIHPEKIDITKDTSVMMKDTVEMIKALFKGPRNYGPSPEEIEQQKRIDEEARLKKEAEEKEEAERKHNEEMEERKKRQDEWTAHLEEVKKEEYELLETQSIPLRNYLMKHVMPTLTKGLIDCCKVRPDDAIDYLAEYLFRNNPQVD